MIEVHLFQKGHKNKFETIKELQTTWSSNSDQGIPEPGCPAEFYKETITKMQINKSAMTSEKLPPRDWQFLSSHQNYLQCFGFPSPISSTNDSNKFTWIGHVTHLWSSRGGNRISYWSNIVKSFEWLLRYLWLLRIMLPIQTFITERLIHNALRK